MKRKTHEQFILEVANIFGDTVEVLTKYKTNHDKVLVYYKNCGHQDYKSPSKLLAGQSCYKCRFKRLSKSKTKTQEQIKQELENIGYKVLGEYKGAQQKIKVQNNKCGHIYEAQCGNILGGSGCPICHGNKNTKTFTEQVNAKYPNEYTILGKYINNRQKILVRHNKCGHEWETIPKDLLKDRRCPKCIMSKGELYIKTFLEEKGIKYIPQYRFDDCRKILPLPFDFMVEINGKIKLIEFDGAQHFKNNSLGVATNPIENDNIKNDYCKKHNIPLLRIPYWWLRNDRIDKELNIFLSN